MGGPKGFRFACWVFPSFPHGFRVVAIPLQRLVEIKADVQYRRPTNGASALLCACEAGLHSPPQSWTPFCCVHVRILAQGNWGWDFQPASQLPFCSTGSHFPFPQVSIPVKLRLAPEGAIFWTIKTNTVLGTFTFEGGGYWSFCAISDIFGQFMVVNPNTKGAL